MQYQEEIKAIAEKYGSSGCLVILGTSDPETAEIYAETLTNGDPSFAGPLAEVPLGLPVYHIFDETIRNECDKTQWIEKISIIEALLDTEALISAVKGMRDMYGRDNL